MNKAEKIICNLIYSFIEENFDKIEYNLSSSGMPTTKKEFLKKIKNNFQDCMWILIELCAWGMDKPYLKELYLEIKDDYNFQILLINGKYLKYWIDDKYEYHIEFTKPKYKKVIYFE